jgi:hypothetical protein
MSSVRIHDGKIISETEILDAFDLMLEMDVDLGKRRMHS